MRSGTLLLICTKAKATAKFIQKNGKRLMVLAVFWWERVGSNHRSH